VSDQLHVAATSPELDERQINQVEVLTTPTEKLAGAFYSRKYSSVRQETDRYERPLERVTSEIIILKSRSVIGKLLFE
jgi:hypothetical protein